MVCAVDNLIFKIFFCSKVFNLVLWMPSNVSVSKYSDTTIHSKLNAGLNVKWHIINNSEMELEIIDILCYSYAIHRLNLLQKWKRKIYLFILKKENLDMLLSWTISYKGDMIVYIFRWDERCMIFKCCLLIIR